MSIDLLTQIGGLQGPAAPQGTPANRPGSSADFGNTLESLLDQHQVANTTPDAQTADEGVFSRHAKARLESRGIGLDEGQME